MSQLDYINLIESIATELQRLYTTPNVNQYLRRFGIAGATQTSVSSKRLYVRDLLAGAPDDLVNRIASDLGLTPVQLETADANDQVASSPSAPYAFISYQHADRHLAARVKALFSRIDVASFMAHDDIEISGEWRARLLEEMQRVTMFVAILTSRYHSSVWCVQESGIAAFRRQLVVVPLSFDGTKPQGFLSQFQAKKVDERTLSLRDMLPSFLKRDKASGLDIAIRIVGSSTNYLDAEENFAALSPHVGHLSEAQIKGLLERSAANEQVQHAGRCAKEFLPPLLRSHGNLLEPSIYEELRGTCERYGAKFG